MTTRTVTFKKTWEGMVINFWIQHPKNVTEKLIFTNGFASSSLDDATEYDLHWIASAEAGTELKLERKVFGVDEDFKELVKWKMPRKPGAGLGEILTYSKTIKFKL